MADRVCRSAINDNDIDEFIGIINQIAQDHPILVDKYIVGKEIEVDAVCDGTDILIPGIMEHIERTGVHSGDSISVYPAPSITPEIEAKLVDYTEKLARALHVKGMINIQFIVADNEVYIIEVNPRSSRTVPYISKVNRNSDCSAGYSGHLRSYLKRAWLRAGTAEEG